MNYFKQLASASLVLSSLFLGTVANAKSNHLAPAAIAKSAAASFDADALKKTLTTKLGMVVEQVKPAPMPGLVEIMTPRGLFYASSDGSYLLQGKLYGLGDRVSDLTEQSMSSVRLAGVDQFKNDMIVFPAKNEKHVITVFTDITCGYCRKLHEQIDDYNDKGITVRYLAYPRAGVTDRAGNYTQGFADLRSIWCHEDPKTAMTKAKAGSNVAQRICDKPVEAEYNFGRKVGVSGTPAIILANGMMLPGYRGPDDMLQILESL